MENSTFIWTLYVNLLVMCLKMLIEGIFSFERFLTQVTFFLFVLFVFQLVPIHIFFQNKNATHTTRDLHLEIQISQL